MGKYEAKKPRQEKQQFFPEIVMEYAHDLAYILAVVLLLFTFLTRVVVVDGDSMFHTLVEGDYLMLINNPICGKLEQGDIVVASLERFKDGEPIIKRVIATEGQWVDIDFEAGIVYVNGTALDEPYISSPTTLFEGIAFPLMVDEGCLFVMGDNRLDSKDSRSPDIGLVDKREILGRAILVMIPGADPDTEKRNFARIGALS